MEQERTDKMTPDEMVKHLREKADAFDYQGWVETAIDYELSANIIEELSKRANEWELLAESWQKAYEGLKNRMPRWIPVTVRLPEDGSDILAVQSCCGEVRIIPANYDRGVWYDCIFNRVAEHITHWMPLPEPPKEEE